MGRPRIEPHDRITIAIRLPRELHEALVEEAIERDMSVNALLTIAVPAVRSGMCGDHRAQIDAAYLARFDTAWDGQGREDWFKLTGHLYEVWWANDRVGQCPQCGKPIVDHDSAERKRCHDALSGYDR